MPARRCNYRCDKEATGPLNKQALLGMNCLMKVVCTVVYRKTSAHFTCLDIIGNVR